MKKDETLLEWIFRESAEREAEYETWPLAAQPMWFKRSKMCLQKEWLGVVAEVECHELKGHAGPHSMRWNQFTVCW